MKACLSGVVKACLITHAKACLPLYHRTVASQMVRRRNAPMTSQRHGKSSPQVTGARAAAQRAKLDAQAEASRSAGQGAAAPPKAKGKKEQKQLLARRRANTTLERAIEDYLADQEGSNHSHKTLDMNIEVSMESIAILGLGLIGGPLAVALRQANLAEHMV
jgi:hypothetical protein